MRAYDVLQSRRGTRAPDHALWVDLPKAVTRNFTRSQFPHLDDEREGFNLRQKADIILP